MTFPFYHFSSQHPSRERRADANGNGGGTARVVRGGSWNNNTEINLRSSYRNNDHPTERNDNNGFRLVVVVGGVSGKASGPEVLDRCRAGGPCPASAPSSREMWTPNPPLPASWQNAAQQPR